MESNRAVGTCAERWENAARTLVAALARPRVARYFARVSLFLPVVFSVVVSWLAQAALAVEPASADGPAEGPYGFTLVRTADEEPAEVEFFFLNKDCATCHPRQLDEVQGAMHSAAHTDPLYRSLAETARREAGDKVYAYCSGCHSAPGVVSGLIPAKHDPELPAEAKAGVTCDVCHQILSLTGHEGPWREPGNASFVLQPGRVKFGHSGIVAENRSHTGEKKDFFAKSEFCASCHTVIHPSSGLRVEHTYGEWKASVYAEKGIQCQDCHMRSVADAVTVARTLQSVVVRGQSVAEGDTREIFPHFFVGGNANADRLSGSAKHAEMAVARLKSAARVEVRAPSRRGRESRSKFRCWYTTRRPDTTSRPASRNCGKCGWKLSRWTPKATRSSGRAAWTRTEKSAVMRSASARGRQRGWEGDVQAVGDGTIPLEADHSPQGLFPGPRRAEAADKLVRRRHRRSAAVLPLRLA